MNTQHQEEAKRRFFAQEAKEDIEEAQEWAKLVSKYDKLGKKLEKLHKEFADQQERDCIQRMCAIERYLGYYPF